MFSVNNNHGLRVEEAEPHQQASEQVQVHGLLQRAVAGDWTKLAAHVPERHLDEEVAEGRE